MRRVAVLAIACAAAATARVEAHRLDEYLQAARLSLGADVVDLELDLTPGVEVAPRLLPVIDLDGDGQLSDGECARYADRVIADATLELDGRPLVMSASGHQCPQIEDVRAGLGTIHLRARAAAGGLVYGQHILRFANTHQPSISAYLVNAMMPGEGLTISEQQRDVLQRQLTLHVVGRHAGIAPAQWLVFFSGIGLVVLLWRMRQARGPRRLD